MTNFLLKMSLVLMTGMLSSLAIPPDGAPVTISPKHQDYLNFKIIGERNIFDVNRTRRSRGGLTSEEAKPARMDTFTLVGTLTYERGPYAFFDGTSADYRKVLDPGKTIADYRIS